MRNTKFAPNEYYHLCGRGSYGNNIFLDEADKIRFLFLILHFQSPTSFSNISFYTSKFLKMGNFGIQETKIKESLKNRQINLVCFALMDNHFHILVENLENGAVSVYMHRTLMAYSKYFNAKYKNRGHVFQGPFSAVHIKDNTQLLHASAYIHKNPKELSSWTEGYTEYPYSSLKDYIEESRWGDLLKTEIISEQFKNKSAYRHFIDTSTAKEYNSILDLPII